jgi:peptide/nickel transport system substrate-binding protein
MRLRSALAFTSLSALLLVACDGGDPVDIDDPTGDTEDGVDDTDGTDDDGTDDDTDDDGDPAATGGTLRAAIGGDPDQLDPHASQSSLTFTVLENVYDTLVQPGDDLTAEPALATDWEVSDDLLTWTFTLREGVTFHDGSEFTSEDVVASFERIRDEGANGFRLESIDEFVAVDELTVELQLNRPTPNLLEQIGPFKGLAIVSAADIEAGTIADDPNGTGPFRFDSFTPAQNVQLSAFEDYWGDGPFLDGIEFQIIPDDSVKLTGLQTGELDWIDSVPPQQVSSLSEGDDIVVSRVAGNDYWYVALNQAREPFDDPDVRRAIAFAIDNAEIAEASLFDAATPNQTAIPETSFWYHEYAPFDRDVDQARELLEGAGVTDLTMELMVATDFPETITGAQQMASQLEEVGITAEIRQLDFTTWLDEQNSGNFDGLIMGWLGNIDPDDFYYAQHHSTGGFNAQGFADDEVDELLDAARVEVDEDERKELYDQAAERIVDLASYIYLYNPEIVEAWSPEVSGYETRPDVATRFVTTSLG